MATTLAERSPPSFLRLAAHPIRWSLLRELGRSDRRVGELCTLLELPQNLVSYHLGRLRAERLVARRRSSADGRDSYYRLELDRCAELLASAGTALHPGLGLLPAPSRSPAQRPRRPATRVLFLCTGNSARSQIAQALAEQLGGGTIEARSAGSRPKSLHRNAIRVLRARGIDIAGRRAKHLDEFAGERFDYVVTLCDRVREVCPEFPGHPNLIHWSIADPSASGATDNETYPAFERTIEELETRIPFLLELIDSAR